MIPTDDEPCLTLLKMPVFVGFVGKYPYRMDDLLATGVTFFDLVLGLYLAVGFKVV